MFPPEVPFAHFPPAPLNVAQNGSEPSRQPNANPCRTWFDAPKGTSGRWRDYRE